MIELSGTCQNIIATVKKHYVIWYKNHSYLILGQFGSVALTAGWWFSGHVAHKEKETVVQRALDEEANANGRVVFLRILII